MQPVQWIQRFDTAFLRLETIEKKGLSSLLEKEISTVTPLLKEGQKIIQSQTHSVASVNALVKMRLDKMQKLCLSSKKKIMESPQLVKSDASIEKKWKKLGLPESILRQHADCARFVVESDLIFTLIGYRETCGDAHVHDLKLDGDGHPMIKLKGNFVRWETIAKELEYDPKTEKIKSRHYSGEIAQNWNYFHPEGLVPVDRFNYDRVFPIYQLSDADYKKLLTHSKEFYKTNREIDPSIPKDCIVQFYTTPRRQGIPKHPLLTNLHKNFPVHIGIRLITSDKSVYSFGYQMPVDQQQFVLSNLLSTFGATAETKISMFDYEECRSFDEEGRIVTSIPTSSQRSQNILDLLNNLNKKQLRFQFGRQNCSSLMQEVMQRIGYDVDIRTTIGASFLDMLPYGNQLPLIGGLIGKVELCAKKVWDASPQWVTKPLQWTHAIIFYIPEKMGTLLMNLLHLKLGAAKKTISLPEGVAEEELYNKKGIQNFSSVIRSWKDIFRDETSAINHSKFFIEWQKKQRSTFVEPSRDRPRLAIVPKS
jgi:hypothetical protein